LKRTPCGVLGTQAYPYAISSKRHYLKIEQWDNIHKGSISNASKVLRLMPDLSAKVMSGNLPLSVRAGEGYPPQFLGQK
jgi:hypothetical protein